MTVKAAAQALGAALRAVEGVRVHLRPPADIAPPAAVVDVPSLQFEAYTSAPTRATFPVYVLVRPDEWAFEKLWDLVPIVTAAIEGMPSAAVLDAEPVEWLEHPGYRITVEVGL